MKKKTILITGANGQVGSVLARRLAGIHGEDQIIKTDISQPEDEWGIFEFLNVIDLNSMAELIDTYNVGEIYHLAAILSANGERNPEVTWDVNFSSYLSLLHIAIEKNIEKIFYPSTIAVFGPTTPRVQTGQDVPLMPTTVYGISKAAGEMWNQYFFDQHKLDVRSIRYPGIIGYQSMPGGGTTDYAVEIFHDAIENNSFDCYIGPDTRLPMIYMDDAIRATIEIMEAPADKISMHYGYNLSGLDFTPAELAAEIKKHFPDFAMNYTIDHRDEIAGSWPDSIDDSKARKEWNWKSNYGLSQMVTDMFENLIK